MTTKPYPSLQFPLCRDKQYWNEKDLHMPPQRSTAYEDYPKHRRLPVHKRIEHKTFSHVTTAPLLKLLNVSTTAIILPLLTPTHSRLSCYRPSLTAKYFLERTNHWIFDAPQLFLQRHHTQHVESSFNADLHVNVFHHVSDIVDIKKTAHLTLAFNIRTKQTPTTTPVTALTLTTTNSTAEYPILSCHHRHSPPNTFPNVLLLYCDCVGEIKRKFASF